MQPIVDWVLVPSTIDVHNQAIARVEGSAPIRSETRAIYR